MGFSRCHEHYGLAAAARAGRRYHIERRHFFFHQGEPARWLYLVVEGQVKLPQVTPEGHQVARQTGTTVFTVSRILSRWEQQGLIKAGRQRIIFRQRHGLTTIAEDLPPSPLQDDS